MSSSRGSSQLWGQTHISYVSCIGRRVLYHECHLSVYHGIPVGTCLLLGEGNKRAPSSLILSSGLLSPSLPAWSSVGTGAKGPREPEPCESGG